MYSTKSETTKKVCDAIGFIQSVGFIKTMVRGKTIFVRLQMLKPNEVNGALKAHGLNIDGKTTKIVNRNWRAQAWVFVK
jgi:hypothetical protein